MGNVSEVPKQNWLEISKSIDQLLLSSEQFPEEVNVLEEWLKRHLDKISAHRTKKDRVVIQNLADHTNRKDSLFFFDSSFNIHNYSGTQNFFSGLQIEYNQSLNLLDLVDETEKPKLVAAFDKAVAENRDVEISLKIKTDIEMLIDCVFHIDMFSSNPANDRYAASLKFGALVAAQLLEYQSLILDSLPGVDIYLLDKNYIYLFAAGKEKERFEIKNIQMFGKTIFEVLDKKAGRLIFPFVNKALQGYVNEGEIRYNKEIYYLKATPVKNYKDETTAAILFSQNITNDKKLEEQLKRGRNEALKADKLKSIFIANLSHEIRTPLNAIFGFSEQLDKTPLTDEQHKYNALIKKASDHLLYLVTEIVFLFKLGMGKVFIEKTPFSTIDLITEIMDAFSISASEKHLKLEFEISNDFPEAVIGDSYRVRQIISNLLTNAIKYTDAGSIKLECNLRKEYKHKVELQFIVSDTGIGISRKNRKKIFDVFEQGNKFNIDFRSGAGLGLSICKRLTEMLDGKIKLTSKVNVGSIFTVCLPFPKVTQLDKIPKKEKKFELDEKQKLLAGKRILLADDDEHNLILSENILKGWETDYVLLDNGEKAIEMLKKVKFDFIIVDIHMPGKNGLDVARFVKTTSNQNSNTPIFFITANAFHTDINNYMKAGFHGFLIKPFKEAELYSKICNLLQVAPLSYSKTGKLKSKGVLNIDKFRTDDLLKTASGDRPFFEKMINNFIDGAESLLIEFKQSAASINWQQVGEKSHKAITSFKYFGLFETVSLLEKIEENTLRKLDTKQAAQLMKKVSPRIESIIDQAKATLIR